MLLIRDLRPTDLAQVAVLVANTFNRNYDPSFYLSIYDSWKSGFLIAEDEKGIIGVSMAAISAPKEARILLMAVRSEYRNRGIGRLLLAEFISRCFRADIKIVSLEVRVSNKKAIRFYRSHGFSIISILPSYYEDDEAGYLMRKML